MPAVTGCRPGSVINAPSGIADEYDMVVLGAGAAGLTTALVAAIEGLSVLVIEKTEQVGGTSARSAGTLWVPGNFSMSDQDGHTDQLAARTYLDTLVGNRSPSALRETFLQSGPKMLNYLQQRTTIRFKPCPRHADYHPELPGASAGGRPVEAELFDGRRLGKAFTLLRSPIPEFMVFGAMMVSKSDIDLLLKAGKSGQGTMHATRLGARYLLDRATYHRGTRLSMGNALCASLLNECLAIGVAIAPSCNVQQITRSGQTSHWLNLHSSSDRQLDGARVRVRVTARHALVFAGGGFSGNREARQRHMPHPTPEYTAAFDGADGSALDLALALGAVLGPSREHNAWWFPSSIVDRPDGSQGVFPHIVLDRAKPGLIAVDRDGQRFANEGISYHQFARAQYAAGAVPCWLVCDHRFIRRYGLGVVRPGGSGLARAVASGYVKTASSLEALAAQINVDAAGLLDSAQRMTRYASSGTDSDFGKGDDPLSRQNGDADNDGPNPCLGPLKTPPFYGVSVAPADLGSSRGLLTDEHARLLNSNGDTMPGLYACGNDMQSIMGGQYPAPGVTLGPAMTFAFIAAHDCAQAKRRANQQHPESLRT